MYVSRKRLNVFYRSRWQDAVPEVEDVAGTAAGAFEDVVGRRENAVERTQQQCRVEVALDGPAGADTLPGVVEVNPPVGANDIAARRTQLAEYGGGPHAEM